MPTIDGGRQHLLSSAEANVFIFFKPGQEPEAVVEAARTDVPAEAGSPGR